MARQFKRKYALILSGNNTKVITDLRVSFEVTKSERSYPNLAKIDIYNPNQETISMLTADDPLIILRVGYVDNEGIIFRGKSRNVYINKLNEDRILTIYAADGGRDWESAIYNKTLSENIKIKDIVSELFQTLTESGEVSIGSIQGLNIPADKLRGQTLSGSTKDILDLLADDYNFKWSIQDGEIILTENNTAIDYLESVIINQSTGMIGSPTVTEIGVEVASLINPNILPGRLFTVNAVSAQLSLSNLQFRTVKRTSANGTYRAYEVIFKGDTHSNEWYVLAKGVSQSA